MAEDARKNDTKAGEARPTSTAGHDASRVKVPGATDHDRVNSLSIRADGTPDQHNPELIGDVDAIRAHTREQFRQMAVSAADVRERGVTSAPATLVGQEDGTVKEIDPSELPQDPTVERLDKAHTEAAEAAQGAADKAVDALTDRKD